MAERRCAEPGCSTFPDATWHYCAEHQAKKERTRLSWRLNLNGDNTVDEVVMSGAHVHLEDLGDAYMLIVENRDQHIHLTIPAHTRRKAFVYEQYTPEEP